MGFVAIILCNQGTDIQRVTKRREARKKVAASSQQVRVITQRKHIPCTVENDLYASLQLQDPHVKSIVVADFEGSVSQNMFCVFIEYASDNIPQNDCALIQRFLQENTSVVETFGG